MKYTYPILFSAACLLFTSCENPADKTKAATVSEAVQVETAPATKGVTYRLSPNSQILFTGSKVTGSHSGGFKNFDGSFTIAGDSLIPSGQKITIDMNSLWSDDEKLTGHLKSEDFFNVAKYPQSSFELTGLKSIAEGKFEVSGNLTLNATTKNITFPATAALADGKASIQAKFDINRQDFGIVYAGKADDLIRDEVVIELKLEAIPEA
jgi:polyisoprenoid-binding protein YceI